MGYDKAFEARGKCRLQRSWAELWKYKTFEGQPPCPIVYRQPLGKCGHGEGSMARGCKGRGSSVVLNTWRPQQCLVWLLGWFSKVKRIKKTNWCHHDTWLKTPMLWEQCLPSCGLWFHLQDLPRGRQCGWEVLCRAEVILRRNQNAYTRSSFCYAVLGGSLCKESPCRGQDMLCFT